MQNTFEHLLGLPTETALTLLTAVGITDVSVVPTKAPERKKPSKMDEMRSDDGYASTRVVAVWDDGRTLVVSRFLTATPPNTILK